MRNGRRAAFDDDDGDDDDVLESRTSSELRVRAVLDDQEAKPARREVLAGILAAGAALGFSGQANAAMNPVAAAKSKAGQAVQGAKDLAGSNPLEGVVGSNPLGDAQSTVEEAASGIKGRIDGMFGKDKVRTACITRPWLCAALGAFGEAPDARWEHEFVYRGHPAWTFRTWANACREMGWI